ncbi:MAG: histidine phosphatase family protein [Oscillospiraceae bacterium]|nr:histidine phosphatase family protein [Oscillospiraceae bacterium]
MEIYLIRHGESFQTSSEYFCEEKQTMNPPLTQKGIEQAHKLADRLKDIKFDKIYASDLDRAVQTADILKSYVNSDIFINKQFREIDMGEIYKKSWNDFPELYSKWILHEEDMPYPNGESGADVWYRCKQQINEIVNLNYKRIAIVCHGGTIRSIICGILNIPQHRRFYFGMPPKNCSVSIVIYKEKDSILHTFNDYTHITK